MIYNNRSYPHPVLGIGDDFKNSTIQVELKVSSNTQYIKIYPIFILDNSDIKNLISSGDATFIAHVYCRGTFYREIFKSQKGLAEPILIPATKLNGEVEMDFFLCSCKPISNYSSNAFNEDYDKTKFSLDKADIIGYAGKGRFYANKNPEELRAISALMNIDCSKKNKESMYLDYSGEKITLMLCQEDYNNYKLLKNNKQYFGIILASLVFPALVEALYFLEDETAKDFSENAWYKALRGIKEKSKTPEPIRIAQNILDNPLNKCLESLIIDESYE